ncbi:MAG: MarR family transcriptional regulator [Chitinophagia bacterium]|nr:MarR family transcriptional regulator [Chitinophagia bacterium]
MCATVSTFADMKLEEALKTNKFTDETHKASLNILYTAYWLKNTFSAAIKCNGITVEQFNVLRILKGKYPEKMCVKDIGCRMIEKNSNVPRIIDRLLLKNLVVKSTSATDKRETLITLTQAGIETLEEANGRISELNKKILCISNEEAGQLNELLEKFREEPAI